MIPAETEARISVSHMSRTKGPDRPVVANKSAGGIRPRGIPSISPTVLVVTICRINYS